VLHEVAVRTCQFETVTVNERGEIIAHETRTAQQFTEDLGGVPLEMVSIPRGIFRMGSRPGQGYADEWPQHSVIVAPFLLGKYPVTQAQWRAVMGSLPPCRGQGADRPVDRVSWHDATRFCQRLSARTGRPYRLPSEAEWEYACRGETITPFSCGETITTDLANYCGEHIFRAEPKGVYRHGSTDVGSFPPNAYGLYDMHGNVWEWCADAWHDDYTAAPVNNEAWTGARDAARVLRGGCWHDPPNLCRSAARLRQDAKEAEDFFGLRVALSLPGL
jgi:formylglycine-generating enzyme required for sulfatase activity